MNYHFMNLFLEKMYDGYVHKLDSCIIRKLRAAMEDDLPVIDMDVLSAQLRDAINEEEDTRGIQ